MNNNPLNNAPSDGKIKMGNAVKIFSVAVLVLYTAYVILGMIQGWSFDISGIFIIVSSMLLFTALSFGLRKKKCESILWGITLLLLAFMELSTILRYGIRIYFGDNIVGTIANMLVTASTIPFIVAAILAFCGKKGIIPVSIASSFMILSRMAWLYNLLYPHIKYGFKFHLPESLALLVYITFILWFISLILYSCGRNSKVKTEQALTCDANRINSNGYGQNSNFGVNQPQNGYGQNPNFGANQPQNGYGQNPNFGANQPQNGYGQNPNFGVNRPQNGYGQNPNFVANQPQNGYGQNPNFGANQSQNGNFQNQNWNMNQPQNGNFQNQNSVERKDADKTI